MTLEELDQLCKGELMRNRDKWIFNTFDDTETAFRFSKNQSLSEEELYKRNILLRPCQNGYVKSVEYLLEEGCYHINDLSTGESWCEVATKNGHLEIIKLFVKDRHPCSLVPAIKYNQKEIFDYIFGIILNIYNEYLLGNEKFFKVNDVMSPIYLLKAAEYFRNDMFIDLLDLYLEAKTHLKRESSKWINIRRIDELLNRRKSANFDSRIQLSLVDSRNIEVLKYLVGNNLINWTDEIFMFAISLANVEAIVLCQKYNFPTFKDVSRRVGFSGDKEFYTWLLENGFVFDNRVFIKMIEMTDANNLESQIDTMKWLIKKHKYELPPNFYLEASKRNIIEYIDLGLQNGLEITQESYSGNSVEILKLLWGASDIKPNQESLKRLGIDCLNYLKSEGFEWSEELLISKLENNYDTATNLIINGCPYTEKIILESIKFPPQPDKEIWDEETNSFITFRDRDIFKFIVNNCRFDGSPVPFNSEYLFEGIRYGQYNKVSFLIKYYEEKRDIKIDRRLEFIAEIFNTRAVLDNLNNVDNKYEELKKFINYLIDSGFWYDWKVIYNMVKINTETNLRLLDDQSQDIKQKLVSIGIYIMSKKCIISDTCDDYKISEEYRCKHMHMFHYSIIERCLKCKDNMKLEIYLKSGCDKRYMKDECVIL